MKKLKTSLKLTPVLLLIAVSSCKKDGSMAGEKDGTFLKSYYIAGKYPATLSGKILQLPYIIQFFDNAKVTLNSGYLSSQGNYTFKNNILTITWDSQHIDTFNITDKAVKNFSGTSELTSYTLQQVPAQNQLNGNHFTGTLKFIPGDFQFLSTIKFSGSQYSISDEAGPATSTDYTLINNAAASSQSGANGSITFMVLIGGNLEIANYTVANASGQLAIVYGTMNKS